MTYFPLRQTTCFFIPLVAPCTPLLTDLEYKEAAKKLNDEICAGLRASKTMLCHQKELNFQRNGKKIHIPEKDLVTEQERDYLVGLIHGLDGNELVGNMEPRALQNELDVHIENQDFWGARS